MLLNKHNLEIAKLSKIRKPGENSSVHLRTEGLHVTPTETAATNGAVLATVSLPPKELDDEYPRVDSIVETDEPLVPCTITLDDAAVIAGMLPKSAVRPVLKNARVHVAETNKGDRFLATVMDADILAHPVVAKKKDVQYPSYANLVKDFEDRTPDRTITFDANLLSKTLAVAAKITESKTPYVKVDLFKDEKVRPKPLRITARNEFTGQTATFFVMPIVSNTPAPKKEKV